MTRLAGLYLRISEDRSGEGLAVDRQREDGRALIASRGWQLVTERVDNDVSAKGHKHRPGFDALLNDIATGAIDTIVCLSMDRLSRNRRDDLRIVEACQPARTLIALVKGSDIDMSTAAGRLVADVMASVARHEIEVKSERHRRQMQQHAAAGLPAPAPRAYGWARDGVHHHPTEAAVIVELYRRFLAGATLTSLAAWLNARGEVTPKGNQWTLSATRVVLSNPRNAGLRGLRPVVNQATGLRAQWHDIIAPGQWEPIVDEPTWRAVMAVLRDPSRGGRTVSRLGGNRPRHLLSGIATCGVCGRYMIAGGTGVGQRTYRCSGREHNNRRAGQLEGYVSAILLDRMRRDDAVDLLAPSTTDVEVGALRTKAMTLREQLSGIAVDYAEGILDREQARVAGDHLRGQLARIEGELSAVGRLDVVAPLVLAEDAAATREVWNDYPLATQRLVVERTMRISVHRGRRGRPRVGAPFDVSSVSVTWL